MSEDLTRYNVGGVVGLLTPQANPVAETETSVLLDPDVTLLTARMTDSSVSMIDRLHGYTRGIGATLATFAGAPLDAIGFACTGSSYEDGEASTVAEAAKAATDTPFVAAADAVHDAFKELGARRLSMVSPYPAELTASARAYWTRRGFEVLEIVTPPPSPGFHPIYGQTARILDSAMKRLQPGYDAILLMGTGAPTLPVIAAATGAPVLSSNLCTGWRLTQILRGKGAPSLADFIAPDAAWRARLAARFPSSLLI